MRIGRNLLSGLASSVWLAMLNFGAIPFYLKYLGMDAYGLIGFFVTIQSLLQVLDLGLAPAVNREVARAFSMGDLVSAKTLVYTLSGIYWGVGAAISIFIYSLSSTLSSNWVHSQNLPTDTVRSAIILMGVVIAVRWPTGLYAAAINGAQRLAITSFISAAISSAGTIGAVIILSFISNSIEAFFLWQALISICYVSIMRVFAQKVLKNGAKSKFNLKVLKKIWKFSVSMSAIALLGAIFMQVDKILLSKLLSLTEFGEYMLAATVAGALSLITVPVFNVIYPIFSGIIANEKNQEILPLYRVVMRGFSSVIFSISLILSALSTDVIVLWTGDSVLANHVGPIIALLAVGTALNAAMTVPHALQLACGLTKLPLIINLGLFIFIVPLMIVLVYFYGGIGGASSWLIMNFLYTILSLWMTKKAILNNAGWIEIFLDICIPFSIAFIAYVATRLIKEVVNFSPILNIILGSVLGLSSMASSIFMFEPCRLMIVGMIGSNLPRLPRSLGS